ncbi:MAG: hypothetical protein ABW168_13465 [Sedimenticola sp.]
MACPTPAPAMEMLNRRIDIINHIHDKVGDIENRIIMNIEFDVNLIGNRLKNIEPEIENCINIIILICFTAVAGLFITTVAHLVQRVACWLLPVGALNTQLYD